MAGPTFVQSSGGLNASNANGTTVSPALPFGWAAGDFCILCVMTNASTAWTVSAGWTAFPAMAFQNANGSYNWYYRVLQAGDTAPVVTWASGTNLSNSNGLYARTYAFRDVEVATPWQNYDRQIQAAAITGVPFTSGATFSSVNDSLRVALVSVTDDPTWSSGMPPAGWTNIGPRGSSTVGGDGMMDGIMIAMPTPDAPASQNIGTMSSNEFWAVFEIILRPAATGTNFSQTLGPDAEGLTDSTQKALGSFPSDTIGLTDAGQPDAQYARPLTDAENLTDLATQERILPQSTTDAEGLADSANYLLFTDHVRSATDPVGLVDSTANQLDKFITDALGMLDAASQVSTLSQLLSEAITLSDLATIVSAYVQSVGENAALSDVATMFLTLGRISTDQVNIQDPITVASVYSRLLGEAQNTADQTTQATGSDRSIGDVESTVDTANQASTVERLASESEGMGDSMTSSASYDRVATGGLGLVDAIITTSQINRFLSSLEGLTDIAFQEAIGDVSQTITDPLNTNDAATASVPYIRSITDAEGETDLLMQASTLVLLSMEAVGITDSVAQVRTMGVTISSDASINDSLQESVLYNRILTELFTVDEQSFLTVGYLRDEDDTVTLIDVISFDTFTGSPITIYGAGLLPGMLARMLDANIGDVTTLASRVMGMLDDATLRALGLLPPET